MTSKPRTYALIKYALRFSTTSQTWKEKEVKLERTLISTHLLCTFIRTYSNPRISVNGPIEPIRGVILWGGIGIRLISGLRRQGQQEVRSLVQFRVISARSIMSVSPSSSLSNRCWDERDWVGFLRIIFLRLILFSPWGSKQTISKCHILVTRIYARSIPNNIHTSIRRQYLHLPIHVNAPSLSTSANSVSAL